MEIKKIDEIQITNAIDLIWSTFLQFEAPDYSEEGIQSFKDFIDNKEILKTLEFWGAYDNKELKGVIATNDNRKHICCFFVKAQYHRQGIGHQISFFPIQRIRLLFYCQLLDYRVNIIHRADGYQ